MLRKPERCTDLQKIQQNPRKQPERPRTREAAGGDHFDAQIGARGLGAGTSLGLESLVSLIEGLPACIAGASSS